MTNSPTLAGKGLACCPACGVRAGRVRLRVERSLTMLNYLYPTPEAAQKAPRGVLALTQCSTCGLVYNGEFEPGLMRYDGAYENSQCHSPEFQQHLTEVADLLLDGAGIRGQTILEVGCGKGDFLRLVCERGGCSGLGYDTTYAGPLDVASPPLRFSRSYLDASTVVGAADAVVCRHVVEHVPAVGSFLREIGAVARRASARVVLLETPAFEWICAGGCFWDLYYEHCNYFAGPTLAWLCAAAGLHVLQHRLAFRGQYQILLARPGDVAHANAEPPPGIPAAASLDDLACRVDRTLADFGLRVSHLPAGAAWGVWGAGAKGVSFVNRLQARPPVCVIDVNPAKHGCFLPGTGTPIVPPTDARVRQLDLVFVANPNYYDEVAAVLSELGCHPDLVRI